MKNIIQPLILALALVLSQGVLANNDICSTDASINDNVSNKIKRMQKRQARKALRLLKRSQREDLQVFSLQVYPKTTTTTTAAGSMAIPGGLSDNIIAVGQNIMGTAVAGWSCVEGGFSSFFNEDPTPGGMVTCALQYPGYAVSVAFEGGTDMEGSMAADTAAYLVDKTENSLSSFDLQNESSPKNYSNSLEQLAGSAFGVVGVSIKEKNQVVVAVSQVRDDTIHIAFSNIGRSICLFSDGFDSLVEKGGPDMFAEAIARTIKAILWDFPIAIINGFVDLLEAIFGGGGADDPVDGGASSSSP